MTQGLANDGALLMPGTGAEHLAGGQPPIGRALHDFGLPDGASEFSARFEEYHCIFWLATAWLALGTCVVRLANPYIWTQLELGITLHAVNSPALASKRWSGSAQEGSRRWGSLHNNLRRMQHTCIAAALTEATCCQQLCFAQ